MKQSYQIIVTVPIHENLDKFMNYMKLKQMQYAIHEYGFKNPYISFEKYYYTGSVKIFCSVQDGL